MKYWEMGEDIALADGVLEEEKILSISRQMY